MSDDDIFTVVTVDVLAVRYLRGTRRVIFGAPRRIAPPFEGDRALPGVVVKTGERLAEAAGRALRKLDLTEAPCAIGQLRTFDEPSRDPRGPSLSVAMWAVYSSAEDCPAESNWFPLSTPPSMAFDHDRIASEGRTLLSAMAWRDMIFTRALTGARFSAADAVAITSELVGSPVHRANLNRDLSRLDGLVEDGIGASTGGRPPKLWRWQ